LSWKWIAAKKNSISPFFFLSPLTFFWYSLVFLPFALVTQHEGPYQVLALDLNVLASRIVRNKSLFFITQSQVFYYRTKWTTTQDPWEISAYM
jgi:hypothetical protein